MDKIKFNKTKTYLILIILLGSILRIYNIGHNSIWLDEAITILDSSNIKEFLRAAFKNNYPLITYNLFIHLWLKLGFQEVTLRLSSAIFGIISIFLTYLVGNAMRDKKTALISALMISISPLHIYYSQEVRMYTLMGSFALLSTFLLLKYRQNNSLFFLFAYACLAIFGIYMHPSMFLLLLSQFVFILVFGNNLKHIKPYLFSLLLIFICLIPWLFLSLKGLFLILKKDGIYFVSGMNWMPLSKVSTLLETLKIFGVGYTPPIFLKWFTPTLFILLYIKGITNEKDVVNRLINSVCFLLPIIILLVFSFFRTCYVDRYIFFTSFFYYIAIASALSNTNKWLLIMLLLIIITQNCISLRNYYSKIETESAHRNVGVNVKFDDYRYASLYIAKNFCNKDIILHTQRNTTLPFEYYFNYIYKDELLKNSCPIPMNDIIVSSSNNKLQLFKFKYRYNELLNIGEERLSAKQNRIWLVAHYCENIEEISKIIKRGYKKVGQKEFRGATVILFESSS